MISTTCPYLLYCRVAYTFLDERLEARKNLRVSEAVTMSEMWRSVAEKKVKPPQELVDDVDIVGAYHND